MVEPAAFTIACLSWGAVGAAALTIGCFAAHNLAVRRREPRVTHFDVSQLEDALDLPGVFECERWRRSGGSCCPAGTMARDCPGLKRARLVAARR